MPKPSDEEIRVRIGEHCPMPHMHMSVMEQECPFCSAWTELGCSLRDATWDAALEEAIICVPMNWCDVRLSGPDAPDFGSRGPEVEQLLISIREAIRALKEKP